MKLKIKSTANAHVATLRVTARRAYCEICNAGKKYASLLGTLVCCVCVMYNREFYIQNGGVLACLLTEWLIVSLLLAYIDQ